MRIKGAFLSQSSDSNLNTASFIHTVFVNAHMFILMVGIRQANLDVNYTQNLGKINEIKLTCLIDGIFTISCCM